MACFFAFFTLSFELNFFLRPEVPFNTFKIAFMPLIVLVDSLGQVLPCQEVEGLGPGLKFERRIWGNITKSEEKPEKVWYHKRQKVGHNPGTENLILFAYMLL